MSEIKYEDLPVDQQRVVQGIRGAEEHLSRLQHEFVKETHDLERRWAQKFQTAYERRFALLMGNSAPSADEISAGEKRSQQLDSDYQRLPSLRGSAKATPVEGFWLQALKTNLETMTHIHEADEPALKHLTNIHLTYPDDHKHPAFIIEFYFSPNKYFTNNVLRLRFYYKDHVEAHGSLGYAYIKGDKINWKPKQSLVKNKPHNAHHDDEEDEDGSFFSLFDPPEMITRHARDGDDHEEREFELDHHFDIGVALKTTILSRATDYFIGDTNDFDSDDDDDNWSDFEQEDDDDN